MSLFKKSKITTPILPIALNEKQVYHSPEYLLWSAFNGYPFIYTMYSRNGIIDMVTFDCYHTYNYDCLDRIPKIIHGELVCTNFKYGESLDDVISTNMTYKINDIFSFIIDVNYREKTINIHLLYVPSSYSRPTRIYILDEACLIFVRNYIENYKIQYIKI